VASGDRFGVESIGLRKFLADVRKADPVIQRQLLARIKEKVTGIVVPDAQSRASWSTRIPGSIRVTASAKTVSIRAGGARAPHAAAFEHGGDPGTFRHPVFGNRDVWVDQQARPFLTPAGQAHEEDLLAAVGQAIEDWVTAIGFR
jgi:hypothetical protein